MQAAKGQVKDQVPDPVAKVAEQATEPGSPEKPAEVPAPDPLGPKTESAVAKVADRVADRVAEAPKQAVEAPKQAVQAATQVRHLSHLKQAGISASAPVICGIIQACYNDQNISQRLEADFYLQPTLLCTELSYAPCLEHRSRSIHVAEVNG